MRVLRTSLLTAALVACAANPPPAEAPRPAPPVKLAPAQVATAAINAVVVVRTDQGMGAGFVVSPNLAITSLHIVRGARSIEVQTRDGSKHEVVNVSRWTTEDDLALVQVEPSFSLAPLRLAATKAIVGEPVVVIGHPLGLQETVSTGVVSAVRLEEGIEVLQISAPISHGSSGGPILNDRAEVIGLVRGFFEAGQSLNFATPSSKILALLREPEANVAVGVFGELVPEQSRQAPAEVPSPPASEPVHTPTPKDEQVYVMHNRKLDLRLISSASYESAVQSGYHLASKAEIERFQMAPQFPGQVAGFAFGWDLNNVALLCGGRKSFDGRTVVDSDIQKFDATTWYCPFVPDPPPFVTADNVQIVLLAQQVTDIYLNVDRDKAKKLLLGKYGAPTWGCLADCKNGLVDYDDKTKFNLIVWSLRGGRIGLSMSKARDATLAFLADAHWDAETHGF